MRRYQTATSVHVLSSNDQELPGPLVDMPSLWDKEYVSDWYVKSMAYVEKTQRANTNKHEYKVLVCWERYYEKR